jgi:hypothetical protein
MYVYQKLWLSDRFLETPSQWQPIGLLSHRSHEHPASLL